MLIICSVTMSVLALCYMTVIPLLSKRYSPKYLYYSWLVIIIGLIIPFRPRLGSVFNNIIPKKTVLPIIQMGNGANLVDTIERTLSPAISMNTSLKWYNVAAAIWFIGMVAFIIYHIVKHYQFIKMTKRWSDDIVKDEQTLDIFHNLTKELGISKQIRLYKCLSIGTPMLVGFINPKILLPDIVFEKDELSFILHHELIHYKRKDLWYKLLVLFSTAVHWFNPVIYFIAKSIDVLCEISCDIEVVRHTDAYTRQHYCEAIIGVVRYQSKMKTALSTKFYGGKEGMKKRMFSIMDMQNKKTGISIFCIALILTMVTGFDFKAKAQTNNSPEYIKENVVISPDFSYGYKFLPDPDIYNKYLNYGISISDDGKSLLYNGQQIKLFVDEHSDVEAFYYDESGTVNISVARNSLGEITGIDTISDKAAQKYISAFFADDTNSEINSDKNKYEQYSDYGITFIPDEDKMYFNGQKVRLFVDEIDGAFYSFWVDEAGTVDLSVIRNSSKQITKIETISSEKAQDYFEAADEYQLQVLNGLEERVEEHIKKLYLDN